MEDKLTEAEILRPACAGTGIKNISKTSEVERRRMRLFHLARLLGLPAGLRFCRHLGLDMRLGREKHCNSRD